MQKFGRYEILEEIGRGGFGRVFRANDPVMKREVAVKVMAAGEDPGLLTRFRNEAASAGHLRHENIVTVYDFGEENGVPYIVMEYLRGMDLQQIQDRGVSLTLLEKVRILCKTAAGLEAAHAQGVIHRDVKPANVMILKDGSVKIMDFGIARLNEDDSTRVTRTGMVMGTLQYIPPEQFEGEPANALTDLWGFGVIAFQLLAGRNPFDAGDTASVIYKITTQQVPDIRGIAPGLPEDLADVVRRLLQRERSARLQSFEDVLIELNPILERLERVEDGRLIDQARILSAQGELPKAHQLVRQVLERHPSNTEARQIRDQIVSQIRSNEVKQQVDDLLRKGDEKLAQSRFDEAAGIYAQACRVSPNNTTAKLRLERATDLAERARRTRAELLEARARLDAGAPRDAQNMVTVILAGDPGNAEAKALMVEVQAAIAKADEAARSESILRARVLASNDQFEEAISMLRATVAQCGDHPDLRKAEEEIRKAAAAKAEQTRIDQALSGANDRIRRGLFAEAIDLLAPLANQHPDHEGIRDALGRAAAERARKLAKEASDIKKTPPPPPPPVQPPPAIQPPPPVQPPPVPLAATVILTEPPVSLPRPAYVPPPSPEPPAPAPVPAPPAPATLPTPPSAPKAGISVSYWVAVGVIGCLAGAGMYIWQSRQQAPVQTTVIEVKPPVPETPQPPKPKVETPSEIPPAAPPPKKEKKEIKETPRPVEVAKAPPPAAQPAVEPTPPKPSGPPPLANTPINPIPWMGARRGTANWSGTLPPGARLVLGSNGVQEGDGVLTVPGGSLPTQDMDVTGMVPDLPHQVFPATRLQRVVIVNNTGAPVTNLRFNWAIK